MAKGGFVTEMLASKHAVSDVGFLWRYMYYMYVALPLLVVYFLIYQYCFVLILDYAKGVFGLPVGGMLSRSWTDFAGVLAINLAVVLALYHFKILPVLFVPVRMLTSV